MLENNDIPYKYCYSKKLFQEKYRNILKRRQTKSTGQPSPNVANSLPQLNISHNDMSNPGNMIYFNKWSISLFSATSTYINEGIVKLVITYFFPLQTSFSSTLSDSRIPNQSNVLIQCLPSSFRFNRVRGRFRRKRHQGQQQQRQRKRVAEQRQKQRKRQNESLHLHQWKFGRNWTLNWIWVFDRAQ